MVTSAEMLKRAAFLDELNNKLQLLTLDELDDKLIIVIDYLSKRVGEINKSLESE